MPPPNRWQRLSACIGSSGHRPNTYVMVVAARNFTSHGRLLYNEHPHSGEAHLGSNSRQFGVNCLAEAICAQAAQAAQAKNMAFLRHAMKLETIPLAQMLRPTKPTNNLCNFSRTHLKGGKDVNLVDAGGTAQLTAGQLECVPRALFRNDVDLALRGGISHERFVGRDVQHGIVRGDGTPIPLVRIHLTAFNSSHRWWTPLNKGA